MTSINNNNDECNPLCYQSNPGVSLDFTYEVDPTTGWLEPLCPNVDDLISAATGVYDEYHQFYEKTKVRAEAVAYKLNNDSWMKYGFEVRLNKVIYAESNVKRPVVIYDGPVTFRKRYGSDELEVY